jgi:hypothetical protein
MDWPTELLYVRGEPHSERVRKRNSRRDILLSAARLKQFVVVQREPEVIEKVVYRDHPAAKMLEEVDAIRAKFDKRKPKPVADTPKYRFSVPALQVERNVDEDLAAVDARLSAEFDDLEARLATVNPEGLFRHTELSGMLFTKRGG